VAVIVSRNYYSKTRNVRDNVYDAVVATKSLRDFVRFIRRMDLEQRKAAAYLRPI